MVQEARTVTVTTTRLQEYHSIQKKDNHVAESARRNCIDTKLPQVGDKDLWDCCHRPRSWVEAIRGGAGGWYSGGDERGKGKSERWAAQKRKSSKNSLPDKLPLPTAVVTPGRKISGSVEKQYPGTAGTTFVQGSWCGTKSTLLFGEQSLNEKINSGTLPNLIQDQGQGPVATCLGLARSL